MSDTLTHPWTDLLTLMMHWSPLRGRSVTGTWRSETTLSTHFFLLHVLCKERNRFVYPTPAFPSLGTNKLWLIIQRSDFPPPMLIFIHSVYPSKPSTFLLSLNPRPPGLVNPAGNQFDPPPTPKQPGKPAHSQAATGKEQIGRRRRRKMFTLSPMYCPLK